MPQKIPSTVPVQEPTPGRSQSPENTIKPEPNYDQNVEIHLEFNDHNLEIEYDINSARNNAAPEQLPHNFISGGSPYSKQSIGVSLSRRVIYKTSVLL